MVNFKGAHMNNRVPRDTPKSLKGKRVVNPVTVDDYRFTSEAISDILNIAALKIWPVKVLVNSVMEASNQAVVSALHSPQIDYAELSDQEFENIFFKLFDKEEFDDFIEMTMREVRLWPSMIESKSNFVLALVDCVQRYCKRQREKIQKQENVVSYKGHKIMLLELYESRLVKSLQEKWKSI